MSKYTIGHVSGLHDPVTGALVGFLGQNGVEYLIPVAVGTSAGAAGTSTIPGSVAITAGTINGATVGQTTAAAVKTSNLAATFTDSSSTPGNVTNNSPRGRVALAAGATTVTVTNSLVTAASAIFAQVRSVDGAANDLVSVLPAAGSFTATMNGATTGTGCVIDFMVVN